MFYLLHQSRAVSGIVALSVNYAVTLLIAKLSYDLFEVKFLRWERRFEYDSEVAEHKHAFLTR